MGVLQLEQETRSLQTQPLAATFLAAKGPGQWFWGGAAERKTLKGFVLFGTTVCINPSCEGFLIILEMGFIKSFF